MSLENSPVTKGLMIGCALTSILAGLFDVKHYLHLQLVPHLSRYHQYWRLGVHHLAFSNSSDLFVAELILYNVGVHIERRFGSVKFASFTLVSTLLGTLLEFLSLILFHRLGLNHMALGPAAFMFSLLYQYSRIVPSLYHFRIFGLPLNNKSFIYLLAVQMAVSRPPGSVAAAIIGILTGKIYRSDLAGLKMYRLPPSVIRFATRFLLPVIGSLRPPRRSNRALPDSGINTTGRANELTIPQNEEIITTARQPAGQVVDHNADGGNDSETQEQTGTSVVRQWVNELTGRGEHPTGGVRVPSEPEIVQLTGIFPDVSRDMIVAALQASPIAEGAVESLLRLQG